jgi:hypothetical protein
MPDAFLRSPKYRFNAALVLALALAAPGTAKTGDSATTEYPMLALSNGVIAMQVYTPDGDKGFYRGIRFDWSGIIAGVDYKGHRFYGPWRSPHQPEGNDFVSGPAEEFAMEKPMGYDEAKPGETFIKVGVGLLERVDKKDYHFFGRYPLVKPGEWTVRSGPDWVEFHQELQGPRGWAYRYTKRISLGQGQATFAIHHKLENSGAKTIDINHYNHNFTSIDGTPFGPNYSVTFPFAAAEPQQIKEDLAVFRGNGIEVLKPLGEESLWIRLRGPGTAADNACTIRNNKTKAGVSFQGDVAISEFRFWSVETAACPEPFIAIQLEPGQAKEWTWDYTLEAKDTLKK